MSWRASAYVKVALLGDRVTRSEKVVLLNLADTYRDETGYASPSVKQLATWSIMSVRQVKRCLTALLDAKRGILYAVGARTGGRGHATEYGFTELPAVAGKGDRVAPFLEGLGPDFHRKGAKTSTKG